MMRIYVVQTRASPMLVDHQRDIKIGYYFQHPNGTETKYYLTAKDNFEVSATTVRKYKYKVGPVTRHGPFTVDC